MITGYKYIVKRDLNKNIGRFFEIKQYDHLGLYPYSSLESARIKVQEIKKQHPNWILEIETQAIEEPPYMDWRDLY